MKKIIRVKAPFTLHNGDAEPTHFKPGRHEVDADTADHWFVKAHCDESPETVASDTSGARIVELEARITQLENELSDADAENGALSSDFDKANAKVAELQAALDAKTSDLQAMADALNAVSTDTTAPAKTGKK